MTVFKQALANAKLLILILMGCVGLSTLLSAYLGFSLYRVPRSMTIYVPAQIPANGVVMSADHVSHAEVYAFTYYIWQKLQTWEIDGAINYENNIHEVSAFLTPNFQNVLLKEADTLSREGVFLRGHQQTSFDNTGFDTSSVKQIDANTWLVHLSMRTINRVAANRHDQSFIASHVASDAVTSFVFKVIRYQYPIQDNPWQLAIAGFASKPTQTMIIEDKQ